MFKVIMDMSQGNPGALNCLMGLITNQLIPALIILPKLEKLGIKGTDIYVFWSDLCNKDYDLMVKLCNNCPDNILKDACSRQDYSGRELVKNYF